MRIGLLGGSFNPAHAGHVAISVDALKRFGLDQVWWLVSPHNPMKDINDMAEYAVRMDKAVQVAAVHPRIRVTDIEQRLGTRYTVDTLHALQARYSHHRLVWLMGADNVLDFHHWKQWDRIFQQMPIIVYDREHRLHRAVRCKATQAFKNYRFSRLGRAFSTPAWIYVAARNHPLSATSLRKKLGKAAFDGVY